MSVLKCGNKQTKLKGSIWTGYPGKSQSIETEFSKTKKSSRIGNVLGSFDKHAPGDCLWLKHFYLPGMIIICLNFSLNHLTLLRDNPTNSCEATTLIIYRHTIMLNVVSLFCSSENQNQLIVALDVESLVRVSELCISLNLRRPQTSWPPQLSIFAAEAN